VYFCLALAATAYYPDTQHLLETHVGAWFGSVPRVVLATTGYLLGVSIAYDFAPHLRPRWNWPLYLGVLASVTHVLLVWTVGLGHLKLPNILQTSLLGDVVFNYLILLLVARIGLPAFVWAWQQERQRPMRLRFQAMMATHVGIGLWSLTGILEALSLTVGWPFQLASVYNTLAIYCAIVFTLSYLMPAQNYVAIAQALDYLSDLRAFLYIRVLENTVSRYTGRRLIQLSVSDVIRAPAAAVYRSVIAIFDGRKLLQIQPDLPARILATQLETAARADLEYPEVVRCLARLGQERVGRWPTLLWQRWLNMFSGPDTARV
jgi:hypothetical protein